MLGRVALLAIFGRRAETAKHLMRLSFRRMKRIVPDAVRWSHVSATRVILSAQSLARYGDIVSRALGLLREIAQRVGGISLAGRAKPVVQRWPAPGIFLCGISRTWTQPFADGFSRRRAVAARLLSQLTSAVVGAVTRSGARAIGWRPDVDQCILALVALAVIFCGSPLCSVYATVWRVEKDDGIALQTQNALAADTWYGVNDALTTDGVLDFRKIFWHLRVVGPTEIDLLAYDSATNGDGPKMVFTTRNLLRWRLRSVRRDGGEIAASSLERACRAS